MFRVCTERHAFAHQAVRQDLSEPEELVSRRSALVLVLRRIANWPIIRSTTLAIKVSISRCRVGGGQPPFGAPKSENGP
jgi:uncharacterized membrane protein